MTPRLPHIAACLAGAAGAFAIARLRSQVKALADGQDALDRGIVEAGADIARANLQISAAITVMKVTPEQAAELIKRAEQAGDTPEAPAPRPAGLPAGHPESLVTELNPADEDELGELCTELWPNDEYLEIITPDGPGAP